MLPLLQFYRISIHLSKCLKPLPAANRSLSLWDSIDTTVPIKTKVINKDEVSKSKPQILQRGLFGIGHFSLKAFPLKPTRFGEKNCFGHLFEIKCSQCFKLKKKKKQFWRRFVAFVQVT